MLKGTDDLMHSTMAAPQRPLGAQDFEASEVLDLTICYCEASVFHSFFFLEQSKELRIIILIEEKGTWPDPHTHKHTHAHTPKNI